MRSSPSSAPVRRGCRSRCERRPLVVRRPPSADWPRLAGRRPLTGRGRWLAAVRWLPSAGWPRLAGRRPLAAVAGAGQRHARQARRVAISGVLPMPRGWPPRGHVLVRLKRPGVANGASTSPADPSSGPPGIDLTHFVTTQRPLCQEMSRKEVCNVEPTMLVGRRGMRTEPQRYRRPSPRGHRRRSSRRHRRRSRKPNTRPRRTAGVRLPGS
jgi:hypothetical protein